jgi:hypothetical protein
LAAVKGVIRGEGLGDSVERGAFPSSSLMDYDATSSVENGRLDCPILTNRDTAYKYNIPKTVNVHYLSPNKNVAI